jgi:dihydroorotase
MAHFDLWLKNATCVLPDQTAPAHIGIKNGQINAIDLDDTHSAEQVIDLNGLHLLPGVIDSQVHFREPGLTHKEDLQTGTRGAVLGGVTSIFEMPNTTPPTSTPEALEEKFRLAQGRAWCNHAFFIGATAENADHLNELEILPGCCGVKIFMGSSTGTLLVSEDESLRRCLQSGRRRMAIHAEDESRLKERKALLGENPHVRLHPFWRDEETAFLATKRILALARETHRPLHILHVTTAQEMAFLKTQKDIATVEVTPQHLFFAAPDCYDQLGTLAQMNPPIRDASHRAALWKALNDGTVTVIGTDHAPHTLEEKAKPYPQTPSGLTGVQTLVPLLLNFVNEGRLSLEKMVELICRNPARLYNAKNKGQIYVGFDADFTVVDLKKEMTIQNSQIASRSAWTPYDGLNVKGWPVMTVIRGHMVMREGQVLGQPVGKPVLFSS